MLNKYLSKFLLLVLMIGVPCLATEDDTDAGDIEEEVRAYESPLSMGLDLQYSPVTYANYALTSGYDVGDLSTRTSQGAHLAIEWLALKRFGKLGIGGATGFSILSGASVPNGDSGQFIVVPLEASLTYRLDYFHDQMLVPFAKAGFEYSFTNFTKSDRTTGWETYPGIQVGFGGQFLLDRLDRGAAKKLDSTVGINNTYLIFEYIIAKALDASRQPNLTRNEARFGLRFEY